MRFIHTHTFGWQEVILSDDSSQGAEEKDMRMTTQTTDDLGTQERPFLRLISSTEDPALWSHPVLDLFPPEQRPIPAQSAKLYLIPSTFGEDLEPDEMPIPTSAAELPELHAWTMKFAVSVIEIWAGRRQPAQLISLCHRVIYMELLKKMGSQKEIGRIRTIHQSQPLDGICESTVTVRFGDRLRAMIIRFEGQNGRWLCTALTLL